MKMEAIFRKEWCELKTGPSLLTAGSTSSITLAYWSIYWPLCCKNHFRPSFTYACRHVKVCTFCSPAFFWYAFFQWKMGCDSDHGLIYAFNIPKSQMNPFSYIMQPKCIVINVYILLSFPAQTRLGVCISPSATIGGKETDLKFGSPTERQM